MVPGEIFRSRIQHLEALLAREQKHRSKRSKMVPFGRDRDEPQWFKMKMEALLKEVNTIRKSEGFKPLKMKELLVLEQSACGHSDYTHKLALYAAELTCAELPNTSQILNH